MNSVSLIQMTAVPEGRLFALDQQTLISAAILLLNVGILALVVGWLLYKPVQQYMQKRTERISEQLAQAREEMAQAQALKTEYEDRMREIRAERAAILEAARLESADRSRKIVDKAQREAEDIKLHAQKSIQLEKERLGQDSRRHIAEISLMMTEKLLRTTIDDETQARLFDEALAEIEEAPWPS